METTWSSLFLVLYGEEADNDADIYQDPDNEFEYGDTAQLDKGVGDRMDDNLSDIEAESNPEYLLFLFLGCILMMFILLLVMPVCVTLVTRNTSQDIRKKKDNFGDNNVRDNSNVETGHNPDENGKMAFLLYLSNIKERKCVSI